MKAVYLPRVLMEPVYGDSYDICLDVIFLNAAMQQLLLRHILIISP